MYRLVLGADLATAKTGQRLAAQKDEAAKLGTEAGPDPFERPKRQQSRRLGLGLSRTEHLATHRGIGEAAVPFTAGQRFAS